MYLSRDMQPRRQPRRLRQHPWARALMAETELLPRHLIQPVFIASGEVIEPINGLPGQQRIPVHQLAAHCQQLQVPAIMLFPATPAALKNATGSEALNPDNLMCRAIAAIKATCPDLGVMTDVALDPYTSHGHDGVLNDHLNIQLNIQGQVDNAATVEILCQQAVVQAEAGADLIAPSDMMDGRVAAIRAALDDAGFSHLPIMSYAAKYASAFYGPFREAVGSDRSLTGDKPISKAGYQMDFRNRREAMTEVLLDVAESADIIMIKPAMPYLDIVREVRNAITQPIAVYQVSGEYAMLHHAAAAGAFAYQDAMLESLMAMRRAGADMIVAYAADEVARWIEAV